MNIQSKFNTSTLEDEGVTFVSLIDCELIVENDLGVKELYAQNDDFAGWTLEYDGHHYEFCRSLY